MKNTKAHIPLESICNAKGELKRRKTYPQNFRETRGVIALVSLAFYSLLFTEEYFLSLENQGGGINHEVQAAM